MDDYDWRFKKVPYGVYVPDAENKYMVPVIENISWEEAQKYKEQYAKCYFLPMMINEG